jgi:hypothetical protein
MLPLKWKIFRVICYVHIAAVTGSVAIFLIQSWNRLCFDCRDFLYTSIFLLMLAVLISNALLNTWMLERFYPARKPGPSLNAWNIILLILFMLSIAFTTFGLAMIFIDVLNDEKPLADNRLKLFLGTYCLVSLTGLPICFFQVSLRRTIHRNYNAGIDSFLESDNP